MFEPMSQFAQSVRDFAASDASWLSRLVLFLSDRTGLSPVAVVVVLFAGSSLAVILTRRPWRVRVSSVALGSLGCPADSPAAAASPPAGNCSLCSRSQADCHLLVQGSAGTFICDDCLGTCVAACDEATAHFARFFARVGLMERIGMAASELWRWWGHDHDFRFSRSAEVRRLSVLARRLETGLRLHKELPPEVLQHASAVVADLDRRVSRP